MDVGKIPPHDVEAEQAILGCMLTDRDSVLSAMEVLKVDDFYREDNKAIYDAMLSLYSRAEPIDIITVKSELVQNGKFDQVGGLEYLAMLPEKVPTTTNVEKYINIVEEKSTLRNLIKTANDIIAAGYDQTEEVENIVNIAETNIFDILQDKNSKGSTSIKDI
jgi:replicative DNA helicase